MNFDLTPENERAAKLHLLIDILSHVYSIEELMIENYCTLHNVPEKEARDKFEKLTIRHRKMIHDIIDAEFGNVDLNSITK